MNQSSDLPETRSSNNLDFLFDLALYISVMFLIREVYFEQFDFIVNGLFWSVTTLVLVTWRMKAMGYGWKKPLAADHCSLYSEYHVFCGKGYVI